MTIIPSTKYMLQTYSAIEHIAKSVWLNHDSSTKLMAIFAAYFDGSGKPGDTPAQSVGGYLSSVEQWLQFENEWTALMKSYDGNTLEIARYAQQEGNSGFALSYLGVGLHPVMDFTSPAQTDANGNPITWCGPAGCKGNRFQVLQHSPNDWIGHERTRDITPQIYALNDQAIRDAYSYVTGKKLSCQ